METQIQKVSEMQLGQYLTAMGLANKLTEKETTQFIQIAKAYNLNPFKREIYGVKYGDNFSIIVGYESYIKRAERSGQLDGYNVITQGEGQSLKAICTIYRKDWTKPFIHEVYFVEYAQSNNFWKTKPITMIKKVCIAQAFRMCFSEEIGGMPYTAEEIIENEVPYIDVTEVLDCTNAIDEINNCESLEQLQEVWRKYKELQKQPEFIEAKNNKKQLWK